MDSSLLSLGAMSFIHHSHRKLFSSMKLDLDPLKPLNYSHVKGLITFFCTRATLWTLWGSSHPRGEAGVVLGLGEHWPTHHPLKGLLMNLSRFQGMTVPILVWNLIDSWIIEIYKPRKAKVLLWEDCFRIAGGHIRGEEHKPTPNLPSGWQIGLSHSWRSDGDSSAARLCYHTPLVLKINSVIITSPEDKSFTV